MGTWHNSDTLYLKFGREEGKSLLQSGMYCEYGNSNYAEFNLDLTLLTEAEQIINDVFVIPDNCMIEKVMVKTLVAAATGTAIDVGLIQTNRSSVIDADGILAAHVTASMDTPGQTQWFFASGTADAEESLPASITTGGALIGDIITEKALVTASRTTATAFTAGKVVLGIWYRPKALSGFAST